MGTSGDYLFEDDPPLPDPAEGQTFHFRGIPVEFQWPAHAATSHSNLMQQHYPNSLPTGTASGQHTVSPIEQSFHIPNHE
jgi:hypothetical protein